MCHIHETTRKMIYEVDLQPLAMFDPAPSYNNWCSGGKPRFPEAQPVKVRIVEMCQTPNSKFVPTAPSETVVAHAEGTSEEGCRTAVASALDSQA